MEKEALVKAFKKKHYGISKEGAVQICEWTKKVLRGGEPCYKQVFYNIHTHRCMEFSPSAFHCTNSCIFCWRPTEYMSLSETRNTEFEKPEQLIKNLIEERRKLIVGFGGRKDIDKKLFEESLIPDHFSISLSGEPLIYPYTVELISYLKNEKKARSIFIVTNGTLPERLEEMIKENVFPSQLYLSIEAPNQELYKKIVLPKQKDSWERYNRFIELFKDLKCRTVLRFTLIKGLNDDDSLLKEYAKIFKYANPNFLEIKSYMFLGYSRKRLKKENMPFFEDVIEFTNKLLKHLKGFEKIDEHKPSRIVLLKNKKSKEKEKLC
jgi:tRNA wybutosine-synthesizing protein 1